MLQSSKAILLSAFSVIGVYGDYHHNSTSLQGAYSNNVVYSRFRRAFATTDDPLSFGMSFSLDIPLVDLGTTLGLSVPFSFDFPAATTTARAASGAGYADYGGYGNVGYGRSFSEPKSQRKGLFNTIEKYLSRIGGVDGHACLKRAICEVAAIPHHDDGILGDAMNLMLKVDDTEIEENPEFADAQQVGQAKQDCVKFHASCPMSVFKIVDSFQYL